VAAGIAILQATRKNCVKCRAGNNPKLPGKGNGPRQPPIRNARAHAALDKYRMLTHCAIVAKIPAGLGHSFVLPAR
jgi:hypothetical protein